MPSHRLQRGGFLGNLCHQPLSIHTKAERLLRGDRAVKGRKNDDQGADC